MLAKRVAALPDGGDWIFEPKWDGFRASTALHSAAIHSFVVEAWCSQG
jgi:ATP-dependent DNA ligase